MAVEVGGIYFSAELDDKKLNQSIKQPESNIRLMSQTVEDNVNKPTEAFKALTKAITYSQATITGVKNRAEKLQADLNKSTISIGASESPRTKSQWLRSMLTKLNASRTPGNSITANASTADMKIAPIKGLFFNGLIDKDERTLE